MLKVYYFFFLKKLIGDGQKKIVNQLLQLCTALTVFSILATVRLYTVMPEVYHWLTNEKQRKTDILLTNQ